jgi:paraquat-inducible protein A
LARKRKTALAGQHPGRLVVPGLIAVSLSALVASYLLPFMEISKFVFWSDDYSLFSSVFGMWEEEFYLLAVVIFAFSIVFPILKLLALLLIWYRRFTPQRRARLLGVLGVLGKWSMLDVFAVALIVVFTQSKSLLGAEPRIGIYVFAAAILLSMIANLVVERVARKVDSWPAYTSLQK